MARTTRKTTVTTAKGRATTSKSKATRTTSKSRATKAPVKRPVKGTKAVVKDEVENILTRAKKAKAVEDATSTIANSNIQWLKLLHLGANETIEGTSTYIKGAKGGDYVLSNTGITLGNEVEATIVGALKVYKEVKPSSAGEMEVTVGFWREEDAREIPIVGYFDRPLSNGNILKPCHWLFLYLHDYPEVQGVVLSFQSVGNKYYKAIMKEVNKREDDFLVQCRILLSSVRVKNETYNKIFCYPTAEIFDDVNFTVDGDDITPVLCDDEEQAITLLNTYTELYESIDKGEVVASKSNAKGLIPYAGGGEALDDTLDDVEYEQADLDDEDTLAF